MLMKYYEQMNSQYPSIPSVREESPQYAYFAEPFPAPYSIYVFLSPIMSHVSGVDPRSVTTSLITKHNSPAPFPIITRG